MHVYGSFAIEESGWRKISIESTGTSLCAGVGLQLDWGSGCRSKDWSLISNLYSCVCDAADAFTQLAFKLRSPEEAEAPVELVYTQR